jgi:2-methylisocitrate lyase-like PEP mutase family enzyme
LTVRRFGKQMKERLTRRVPWSKVLKENTPLLLPVAHDALTARLIERAGFPAYQIGGFALVAAMHAVPDIDLEHFGEKAMVVENIISASSLPALVDGDDGYGDPKNVTRTVHGYEAIGAAGLFIEDQQAPKKCGHMSGKKLVEAPEMVAKVKAALHARSNPNFFIMARTDAIGPEGLDSALIRAQAYLDAGADGLYFEAVKDEEQLRRIGKTFKGVPLATSVLERGGETPFLSPGEFKRLGFSMILYPTTLLFQATWAIERALETLKNGKPMPSHRGMDRKYFEEIVDMAYWAEIENRYSAQKKAA